MTEDNIRAIQVVAWLTVITSILIIVARVTTRATVVRSLSLYDYLIAAALLFGIGQTAAVSTQTYHGYGKPLKASSSEDQETNLKAEYTAALFYIPALYLSKLAVLALIRDTVPGGKEQKAVQAAAASFCLWAIIGEFVAGFSCSVPRPWDYVGGKCINRYAWWNSFETVNIFTDTALIVIPFICLFRRQASLATKTSVISFFVLRIMVIIAAICKLVYLTKALNSPDQIQHTWPIVMCSQIIQCFGIVSASFSCLHPCFNEKPGSIGNDVMQRKASSQSDIKAFNFSRVLGLRDITRGRHAASAVADSGVQEVGWDPSLRAQEYMGQVYMIKETKTFAVQQEALACRYC